MEIITNETVWKKILETIRAIEIHIELSCIAMGMIQILFVRLTETVDSNEIRYLWTPSAGKLSETGSVWNLLRFIGFLSTQNCEKTRGRLRNTILRFF